MKIILISSLQLLFILGECTSNLADLGELPASPQPVKSAVAFAGGGFLAHAVYSGVIQGLTQVVSKQRDTEATLTDTNLLDRFDVIASNSGGSWFMSQLAFSDSFLSLMESAASNPNSAEALYIQNWVEPLLRSATGSNPFQGLLQRISPTNSFLWKTLLALFERGNSKTKKIAQLAKGVDQSLEQLSYIMPEGVSWSKFVANLLLQTSNIDTTTRLGDKVNEWAKGKTWVVSHSLVTPGGDCPFCNTDARFWSRGARAQGWYKLSNSQRKQPLYTPVRYSIRLGAGQEARSPLPYCAPGMCDSLSVTYQGYSRGFFRWQKSATSTAKSTSILRTDDAETFAGSLPLYRVVAASSAFPGGHITTNKRNLPVKNFAVWSSSSGAESFSVAEELREKITNSRKATQSSFDELGSNGLHALIDGGNTENLGIAHAIAAGAEEVVAFSCGHFEQLLNHFQGSPSKVLYMGVYKLYFKIFKESASQIQNQLNNFETLDVGTTKHLKSVTVGSLTVTTVDSAELGIAAGRTITLHLIDVESSLWIGGTNDYRQYATLVQEIVSAVVSPVNQDKGTKKLVRFMLGM